MKYSERLISVMLKCYTNENLTMTEISHYFKIATVTIKKIFIQKNIRIKNRGEFIRKYQFNETIFSNIDTPEKAYWLGFIFGDGSVNKFSLRIELNENDINHLYKFLKFIDLNNKPVKTAKNCYLIHASSVKMIKNLNKLNIITNKTKNSDKLPDIESSLFKYMILGLFDSDGWVSEHKSKKNKFEYRKSQYEYGFSSSHVEILKLIQKFLTNGAKLNTNGYISNRKNKCPQLIIGGRNNFIKIKNYLYDDISNLFSLDRKRIKSEKFYNLINNKI